MTPQEKEILNRETEEALTWLLKQTFCCKGENSTLMKLCHGDVDESVHISPKLIAQTMAEYFIYKMNS